MNTKIVILACVFILILAGVVSAFVFTNTQEESSLIVASNSTLYEGDNYTVKLIDKNSIGIANKTINVTLTNENGSTTNFESITNTKGQISFNISDIGNYSVECVFNGDGDYESSNISKNVKIIQIGDNNPSFSQRVVFLDDSSSNVNYCGDDYLSCEELKAKYPEKSDEELLNEFGERGDNGIMYNGKHVWEDRGDGRTYSGHLI